jgi:hypothetical protein
MSTILTPSAPTPRPTNGIEAAAAERQRQLAAEGWSAPHDDTHVDGELSEAAGCYVYAAVCLAKHELGTMNELLKSPPVTWPWSAEWWKPSMFPQRNLEKAMALLAADWDRFERFR